MSHGVEAPSARGKGPLHGKSRPGATGNGQDLRETIPTKRGDFLSVLTFPFLLSGWPSK